MSDEVIAVRLPRLWSRELARIAVRSGCSQNDVILCAVENLLDCASSIPQPIVEIDDE